MSKFKQVLDPIAELLQEKNADYGNSFHKLRDKYGPVAFYIKLADKMARIEQVDKNGALVNETVLDTLMDIIGYCVLEIIYRRSRAGHSSLLGK